MVEENKIQFKQMAEATQNSIHFATLVCFFFTLKYVKEIWNIRKVISKDSKQNTYVIHLHIWIKFLYKIMSTLIKSETPEF